VSGTDLAPSGSAIDTKERSHSALNNIFPYQPPTLDQDGSIYQQEHMNPHDGDNDFQQQVSTAGRALIGDCDCYVSPAISLDSNNHDEPQLSTSGYGGFVSPQCLSIRDCGRRISDRQLSSTGYRQYDNIPQQPPVTAYGYNRDDFTPSQPFQWLVSSELQTQMDMLTSLDSAINVLERLGVSGRSRDSNELSGFTPIGGKTQVASSEVVYTRTLDQEQLGPPGKLLVPTPHRSYF